MTPKETEMSAKSEPVTVDPNWTWELSDACKADWRASRVASACWDDPAFVRAQLAQLDQSRPAPLAKEVEGLAEEAILRITQEIEHGHADD